MLVSFCLLLSSSSFLFALTVEGIQVWTFPPDTPSMVLKHYQELQRDQEHNEAFRVKDEDGDTLLGTPRPCLLHVQELEVCINHTIFWVTLITVQFHLNDWLGACFVRPMKSFGGSASANQNPYLPTVSLSLLRPQTYSSISH